MFLEQSKVDREPVVSVSSIHVEENSGVVITNSSLSVFDKDTPENEILFTIIRKPSYGKYFNSGQPTLKCLYYMCAVSEWVWNSK